METIGFIGLGIMGAPMAGHLLDAGYAVVASDHRSRPAEALIGKGLKTVSGHDAVARAADSWTTLGGAAACAFFPTSATGPSAIPKRSRGGCVW